MADQIKPASTFAASRSPIVEKDGTATRFFIKLLQDWDTKLRNGLNSVGQLIGNIDPATRVMPRTEGLGTTLQHINSSGVILPDGLTPATTLVQGAVLMPSGATDNHLGTAAIQSATAFDASGSAATAQANAESYAAAAAATAQSNAESHADTVANTAQSNAEAFAGNAANITSGTLNTARLGGLSVTITTAPLTVGGTTGSMTFTSGLLTARAPAT